MNTGNATEVPRLWAGVVTGAAILVACTLALFGLGRQNNVESQSRLDMQQVLNAISMDSAGLTDRHLTGAETSASLIANTHDDLVDDEDHLLAQLANLITFNQHLDSAFIGYPDGSFYLVGQSNVVPGGFRIRTVTIDESSQVYESFVNADLDPLTPRARIDEFYDPRAQPWFTPIANGASRHWTEPTPTTAGDDLGITHSVPLRDPNGTTIGVVGIGMQMSQLNTFLAERQPSENGSARIVNAAGKTIIGEQHSGDHLPPLLSALTPDRSSVAAVFDNDAGRAGSVRSVGSTGELFLVVEAPTSDFVSGTSGLARSVTVSLAVLAGLVVLAAGIAALRYFLALRTLATVDQLTGLTNRNQATHLLEQLLTRARASSDVTVAVADLDDFKTINDLYGHDVGDKALKEAAQRIRACSERYGFEAGRFGGDEFVIFGRAGDANLDDLWNEIHASLAEPFDVSGALLDLRASIGASRQLKGQNRSHESILREADQALYAAKAAGRHTHRWFDQRVRKVTTGRPSTVIDMRLVDTSS